MCLLAAGYIYDSIHVVIQGAIFTFVLECDIVFAQFVDEVSQGDAVAGDEIAV
jgi:hypothetical protein